MAEISLELNVLGMTCDSCASHVERALKSVPGVRQARVPGWQSGQAEVVADDQIEIEALLTAVSQAGYSARLKASHHQAEVDRSAPRTNGHDFDLMVIGGGSAGFAAAIKGAELGARVALVEAGTIGGTCVNVGCVPSKTLIRAIEQYHQAAHPRFRGVRTQALGLDWAQVIAQKDQLVAELRQSKYLDVLAAYPQITLLQGRAHLLGGTQVEIEGRIYHPRKIVLATGASPWAPPIPGLPESGYLTSTTAMELTQLPSSMMVLGANAVGLELAQVFARAGTQVTVLELLPRIAPFEDEDISHALHRYLEDEGMPLIPDFKTLEVQRLDGAYRLRGERGGEPITLEAEQLLVATGRRPNTSGLGLEQAGVEVGRQGEVIVDSALRTSNPDIYAAGDVTGRDMFVYVAAYAGGLAAENALTNARRVYDVAYLPRVTFTDPQIASAGLTEAQARQQGYAVKVSLLPMDYVPRAQAAHDRRGLIKLVVDATNDRLLGAHILAPEAGEIIQVAVLALRFGLTLSDLRQTLFPYLTNVEGIKLAALALEKDVSRLSCCAG